MTGAPDTSGGRTLSAAFTAKTFIYIGDKEEEPKKPPAPKPGGPKAGG